MIFSDVLNSVPRGMITFRPHSILSDPCGRMNNIASSLASLDGLTKYAVVRGGVVNLTRNRQMERDQRRMRRQAAINREI